MYYVMSLVGYEAYVPVWFKSEKSKEEFEVACKKVSQIMVEKAMNEEDHGFITGYDITGTNWNVDTKDYLYSKMYELGFEMITPSHEYSFGGECLYNEYDKKDHPDTFSEEVWDKILKHNRKVREDLHKDMEENKITNNEGK